MYNMNTSCQSQKFDLGVGLPFPQSFGLAWGTVTFLEQNNYITFTFQNWLNFKNSFPRLQLTPNFVA